MDTTQPPATVPQYESDTRTQAQKESDARALADKVDFEKKVMEQIHEERYNKPMMRVVAYDETDQKEPKADPKRAARLKKLYGF